MHNNKTLPSALVLYRHTAIAAILSLFAAPALGKNDIQLTTVPSNSKQQVDATTEETSLVSERVKDELATSESPFVLTPHKVNYFLPATYNSNPNNAPFAAQFDQGDYQLDEMEAKFQLSFKFPLVYNLFGDNGHVFLAYTNQSYWQVYNQDISSPFRETNHEPEAFILFNNDWQIGGFTNSFIGFGAAHQSNGKAGLLSRSWNRLYGTMIFDKGPYAFSVKAWWRLPEDAKETPDSPKGDDNPDLTDYLGHVEFTGVYGLNEHRFSLLLRNNFNDPNRGALELTWSYPIMGNLRIYTQYFNGYGESLIDYNHHNQRIGIGFSINDIL
ncbi:phospholipase A [Shewanella sp. SR44-3]|uniref:phospholipase A n=1 Tax=Shewanella sp. SR44-3 TaxID=2760936 RepID=UPI0015FAF96D|nr:phospholipase A [Shewanella sp. SR44-3]MBB1270506.1 phospholipase A [Shewanella sp. SR44-3]